MATVAILQERLSRDQHLLTEQLHAALADRVAIEQATGVLSARLDIGTDEAFERLRERAHDTRRRVVEVAEAVVRDGVDNAGESPKHDTKDPEKS